MPIIIVELLEGRTTEQKSRLAKAIANSVAEALEISKDQIDIVIHDIPKTNIAKAGILASERK